MRNKKWFLQKYHQAQHNYYAYKVKNFIGNNWQKLTLLLLIIIVFSYKDLTIHFDLSSSFGKNNTEVAPKIEEQFPNGTQTEGKQGFTEQIQKDSRKETFSFFPSLFGGKTKKDNVPTTLEGVFNAVKTSEKQAYLKRYSHIAVEEMKHYGIPASIILAQALLHGQAGNGDLAKKGNNHFSITCGSSWKEKTKEIQGVCYRSYKSAWKSFRDHSELITKGRFTDLKQYSSTDYKKWANGLQEKGYSTDKKYAALLISIINEFELDKYDE